jgi:succinoglycan biosynthesis transport protein ExoP
VGSMVKVMQRLRPADATDETPVRATSADGSRFVQDGPALSTSSSAGKGGDTSAWDARRVDPAIVAFHEPHSSVCEQYRALRARLLALNPARAPQVIAITSAVPEEGKSVSAANLALTMAEGGEHRVLLAGADFRRGRLARMLGIAGAPGLAEVLGGAAALATACQTTPWANLRVLPAGGETDTRHAVLGTWAALLTELRATFDYALLDMPPVTTVSDVSLLAPHCDAAILVVLMRRTPEPIVQQAVRTLQANHVRVLGAVLSRFDERGPGYYDYADTD